MPLLGMRRPDLPASEAALRQRAGGERSWTAQESPLADRRAGLFETCANPHCSTGWLRLWRSRSGPILEGGWSCSPGCTEELVRTALRREMEARGPVRETHRHRVPLGLLMMEQGWITAAQLRQALEAQRTAGGGRLGQWLMRLHGISEELMTRALGLQWSCPVLGLEYHDAEALTALVPRLFLDAYGALPLRVAAGRVLYLGFADRLDPVLALAVERMTGMRVECGVVCGAQFGPAHQRMLAARFPHVELIEAASEAALARAFARALEKTRPVAARLVRVHDCLWLRMSTRAQGGMLAEPDATRDVIGLMGIR